MVRAVVPARFCCLLNPRSLPDIVLYSSWEMQDVIISPLLWIDCCDITLTTEIVTDVAVSQIVLGFIF